MNLIRLLASLGPWPLRRVVAGAAGSALGSSIALAVINMASSELAKKGGSQVNPWLAAAFVAAVGLYAWAESWTVAQIGADMETAIDRLRMRLIGQIRRAALLPLERFGEAPLFENITQSCQTVSVNSQFLALSLRAALLIVAVMIYILAVSPLAFAVIAVTLAIGGAVYQWMGRALDANRKEMAAKETALYESVADLFDGFKEQRLNSARSRDLGDWFSRLSRQVEQTRDEVHLRGWQQYVFGETGYTLMLGVVVFIVPSYSPSFDSDVVKVTAACLFMASSVFGLMQSMAVMAAAEAAAGRMLGLEKELGALAEPRGMEPALPAHTSFEEIRLCDVAFEFPAPEGERPFAVGPFNLTIRRGETIFITGGNGSGKSTFLKLLTGLYAPLRGRLLVDGVEVGPDQLASYRALMATVFCDFHLFARLYGIDPPSPLETADLLRWMEIERITSLDRDRFTRRDLSAGQRKRLALIAALLEHKSILVLDEWAADQDPQFRRKFYREVAPELKKRGLTIIAVTHDDHYFDAAERRLHMEEGQLAELTAGGVV